MLAALQQLPRRRCRGRALSLYCCARAKHSRRCRRHVARSGAEARRRPGNWKGTGSHRARMNRIAWWAATWRGDLHLALGQCARAALPGAQRIMQRGGNRRCRRRRRQSDIREPARGAVAGEFAGADRRGAAERDRHGAESIADYAARLATALPQYQVRPIRQVAEAEGALLVASVC